MASRCPSLATPERLCGRLRAWKSPGRPGRPTGAVRLREGLSEALSEHCAALLTCGKRLAIPRCGFLRYPER